MKTKRTLILAILTTGLIMSCEDSATERSFDANYLDSISKEVENDVEPVKEKPTRRSLLVNSSPKVVSAHAKLRQDVSGLKLELERLKLKRQTPRIQTKIAVVNEQISFTRQQYIAIERNDIKADDVSLEKKVPYTELLYELVKIKGLRKKYEDRNDPVGLSKKADLDHNKQMINKKIDILLKQ